MRKTCVKRKITIVNEMIQKMYHFFYFINLEVKMSIEQIGDILSIVLSAVAAIIAIFKKSKTTKTLEEIETQEEAKKQKRIEKQLKKNKIKVDTATKSEVIENSQTNYTSNNQQQKQWLLVAPNKENTND